MLIGLSGYAQSGKDTAAAVLVEEFGFVRVSFADKLRELALAACGHMRIRPHNYSLASLVRLDGWERAKKEPDVRELLQKLGTGVRDIIDPDAWVKAADLGAYDNVVVSDMRFPNEFEAVKRIGVTIRVTRPGYGPINGHISEVAIDGEAFDLRIDNDGTVEQLRDKVRTLVETVAVD